MIHQPFDLAIHAQQEQRIDQEIAQAIEEGRYLTIGSSGTTTYEGYFGQPLNWPNYTVGLFAKGWPELLVTGQLGHGISFGACLDIIQEVIQAWQQAGTAYFGDIASVCMAQRGGWVRVGLPLADRYLDYAPKVLQFAQHRDVQLAQLMWPDRRGKFPNDADYYEGEHTFVGLQPVLPLAKD